MERFIQRLKEVRGKGNPPAESQGSEWTPLLSKLLREEPGCGWIQTASDHTGVCLKDMSGSNLRLVHS